MIVFNSWNYGLLFRLNTSVMIYNILNLFIDINHRLESSKLLLDLYDMQIYFLTLWKFVWCKVLSFNIWILLRVFLLFHRSWCTSNSNFKYNFKDRHRVLKTWSVSQIWVYMWPVLSAKPLGSPILSITHTPVYSRAWKKHPWFPIVILSVKLVDL